MAGGTQKSIRKVLGSLKDTTTVSLAKVNSDYKELDIAIVKATNHVERPAKEKYIRAIFSAVSATRPRADVAYCIHGLARRLAKTHNWAVALKTLIVIHRALREVDPTFHEELMNYGRSRNHMLNLSHFKDDSSPNAWDYSTWIRSYALFLEERLECCRVLKSDIEMDRPRTKDLDTAELLEHLPALQQLLFRVLGCQPQGASVHNFVVQLALSMVALESIKIYQAISDGTVNLVDKFFEMQRNDALKALDIYRRAGQQAERLSEFYEVCKNLDIGRGEKFIKIEQPPASFLQAMEEYVREAPRVSIVRKDQAVDNKLSAPKEILAIEYKKTQEAEAPPPSPPPPPPPEPVKVVAPVVEPPDLLGLNDPAPDTSALDEKNAMALAIVPVSDQPTSTAPTQANGTGWELALVTAPSSNESATAASKLAGGLDLLTLDSLYDDAIRRNNQNVSYNPWEPAPMTGGMMLQPVHDPFFASNTVAAPPSVQMAAMANQQQQAFMFQQQQQMMMMGPQQPQSLNPFGNPHGAPAHPYGTDFSMSDAQREHAATVEQLIPGFADLRVRVCNSMTEEKFWMIYFLLLLPRLLNEDDFELLSTPKIIEARDVLLHKLQKKNTGVDTCEESTLDSTQKDIQVEKTQGEENSSPEKKDLKDIVNTAERLKIDDEESCEQWSEEASISSGTFVDDRKKLEHEEDISFSDLEDSENDLSSRPSGRRPAQDVRACSPNGSNDWVRLNKSSEIDGGHQRAGMSKGRDSEGEESNDWLTVDEFD